MQIHANTHKNFLNNKTYRQMRTILIVFAILLVLLTLLGTFGGSIRQSEPFYDLSSTARTQLSQKKNKFYDGQMPEPLPSASSGIPELPKAPFVDMPMPSSSGSAMHAPFENEQRMEHFYEQVPLMPDDVEQQRKATFANMPNLSSVPAAPKPPSQFVQEGFMIEPFEDDSKTSYPAAY